MMQINLGENSNRYNTASCVITICVTGIDTSRTLESQSDMIVDSTIH